MIERAQRLREGRRRLLLSQRWVRARNFAMLRGSSCRRSRRPLLRGAPASQSTGAGRISRSGRGEPVGLLGLPCPRGPVTSTGPELLEAGEGEDGGGRLAEQVLHAQLTQAELSIATGSSTSPLLLSESDVSTRAGATSSATMGAGSGPRHLESFRELTLTQVAFEFGSRPIAAPRERARHFHEW